MVLYIPITSRQVRAKIHQCWWLESFYSHWQNYYHLSTHHSSHSVHSLFTLSQDLLTGLVTGEQMPHSIATSAQFVLAWEPCKRIKYLEHSLTITSLYVFSKKKNPRLVFICKSLSYHQWRLYDYYSWANVDFFMMKGRQRWMGRS